ncbi:thrombopoietin receptor isoform X1 [Amphiprion ocellaris]|uniref:Fibronectin type-III domain-containing protein n=1 Tax=Amphiprion ocellaris TaxID=80972 RepID=A0AAQ5ZV31_AMPOC|nr:thrombopoietin receptor isoform X1 [Amphiprion ocellaris]
MDRSCELEIFLIFLWIQVGFVPGIHCNNGIASHLSKEDLLLLKDEENPKCFTQRAEDFTCFFETADDGIYDLFYTFEDNPLKSCNMSVRRTEEGTFLHICSFPYSDVMLYVDIYLKVLEHATKTSLYNRTVNIEDHFLLDPPFNVTLHPNGQVGQLQVSWRTNSLKYWDTYEVYRIRYSSRHLGQKTKEVKKGDILNFLVAGEEVEVQIAVKYAMNSDRGHWSSWSHLVRTVVPQSADDISLMCYTSDLHKVTCQWNASRYGAENEYQLFFKTGLSEPLNWSEWTECQADGNFADLCSFSGVESRKVRVQLNSSSSLTSRTFYSEEFTLKNSVKTSAPDPLRGALNKDKLCLEWDAPLPSLSTHLQYEVDYRINGAGGWKMIKDFETHACIEVQAGSQYSVKVRAQPTGSFYSGHWSDWSDVLTGDTPTDIDLLLMLCIPTSMLVTAVIFISLLSTYLSKLKQYFWPPVPNLEKVLQGYLMEINRQKWDPPVTAKQWPEETTSSVVEIMSEDEVSGLGKPTEESRELLSPEQVDGNPRAEVFPDYVTLNKESAILCPQRNSYIYDQVKGDPEVGDELLQTHRCSCTEGSVCVPLCSCSDFLNESYLPLAEPADTFSCKVKAVRAPGNLYTNFPSS